MSNRIKIQHYVPRFYLQNFTIDENKDYLYCFDKTNFRKFRVNCRNIASESYFYDITKDADQQTEKGFSELESLFHSVYGKLIVEEDLGCLTSFEKLVMAYFVATQEIRTREHRITLKHMIKGVTDKLSKEEISPELEEKLRLKELKTEEGLKALHMGILEDVPKYAEIMYKMKWVLFINRTDIPCWCSDHPVNRSNSLGDELGLLSNGIEIDFPLTPSISLCLGDPALFWLLPNKYEILDEQNIIYLNSLQVSESTRYVFSNKDDFYLAEKIIRKDPSLGDIDRRRIIIH